KHRAGHLCVPVGEASYAAAHLDAGQLSLRVCQVPHHQVARPAAYAAPPRRSPGAERRPARRLHAGIPEFRRTAAAARSIRWHPARAEQADLPDAERRGPEPSRDCRETRHVGKSGQRPARAHKKTAAHRAGYLPYWIFVVIIRLLHSKLQFFKENGVSFAGFGGPIGKAPDSTWQNT